MNLRWLIKENGEKVYEHPIFKKMFADRAGKIYRLRKNKLIEVRQTNHNGNKGMRYYRIGFSCMGKNHFMLSHRFIWECINGLIKKGMVINHKDLNGFNNRIYNLEVVTHQENINHAKNLGRFVVVPVPDRDTLNIVALYLEGHSFRSISKQTNYSRYVVTKSVRKFFNETQTPKT